MLIIGTPAPIFPDFDGTPLENGFVYIGQPNLNPEVSPVQVYWDLAGTQPAAQPIRTIAGMFSRFGTPANVYTPAAYSLTLKNKNGSLIGYFPTATDFDSSVITNGRIDDIANSTDMSKGVALVGGAGRVVATIAVLKTLPKTGSPEAFVMGYYAAGDGGGGQYRYDSSDAISTDNGGTIIVAADGGRWKLVTTNTINVRQFGAKGDNSTDDTAAIQACRDWAVSTGTMTQIVFTRGIYKYSVSPNWGVNGLTVRFDGEVRLRYTGVGNAVIIDAGASPAKISNVHFGVGSCPIIEAPATAGHGLYARGLIRGDIQGRCYGAGSTSAGLRMEGCVLVGVNFVTTNDEGGAFYLGAKPQVGISLSENAVGGQTSYCLFQNCNVQSCAIGWFIDSALGNVFVGGDSEFNTQYGMQMTTKALNNKFYGCDFEQNVSTDVICAGSYNEFSVDTSGTGAGGFHFVAGSVGNRLIGGEHDQVSVDAGNGNYIGGIVYGRGLSGNLQILDLGTKTAFGKNWQAQQQRWSYGPSTSTAITVTASPFAYQNATGMAQYVVVTGGTVSSLVMQRGAQTLGNVAVNGVIRLEVGDQINVTYTVAPTMLYVTI